MSNSILDMMNRKLNVLSFAMGVAALLCVLGAVMIFSGIKDSGSIDFSSTFATGQAKSGFVGVTLIFCSMIVTIGALRYRALENTKRQLNSDQTIRIKHGDIEIEWKGNLTHWNDSHHVKELLNEIMLKMQKNAITDNVSSANEK
ncbi:MAG: hypothetical protein KKE44_04485 [Proteobacteria bacterium]|nr:hypothetical protein [Pseudomonadota bacterium]MBU1581989.1 hypothetical protein [Pseudomonadota bacterium]MBU2452842.1 hypothetical protein [Pseudomonadota bacterium]MBU2628954.1 hypothetical protein [Pseudomonadota bacterium]